jgi:hypothetical protein
MAEPCTVLIAATHLLPALKQRAGTTGEVLTFTDGQPIAALEAIVARRPQVVALERLFAATPRGAALISRIKSDPTLTAAEIRVVSHDTDYARVSPRKRVPAPPANDEPTVPRPALDYRGTRREPRFRMPAGTEAVVDGATVSVVDLSVIGVQVVGSSVLRPNHGVRLTLADDLAVIRLGGRVAWAFFEMRPDGHRYRAGIEFCDASREAVQAFLARHPAA